MKTSIIIPFYNTPIEYFSFLLKKIEETEKNNLQYIFVNDGSNESLASYAREYCKKNDFNFIDLKKNQGVSNARNEGLKAAKGDFVMFVDSDDYIDFNFINNIAIKDDCDLYLFKDAILKKDNFTVNENLNKIVLIDDIFSLYVKDNMGLNLRSSCCKLIRNDFIKKENIKFDANLPFYEDAMFMSEVYLKCKSFKAFDNIVYYYRIYPYSSSKKFNKNYFNKYDIYFNKYKSKFNDNKTLIHALYKDTFNKVLFDKFIRSIKSFHFYYAYKILKNQSIIESTQFLETYISKNDFKYKIVVSLKSRKYLRTYFLILFGRIFDALNIRIKKLLKK